MATLRVGIIGANAQSGWARDAHVPAVRALKGMELTAVATRSRETAAAAGAAFGVRAYDDGFALCSDPGIDIVTVATRVPDHRRFVFAALANGKHVYCEWPLGRGIEEARELAEAARASGRHVAIGLQLRSNPAGLQARRLIEEGAIGRILGINVVSTTAGFGPQVAESNLYLEQPDNFANLVTIQSAHTLDLALQLVGDVAKFDAVLARQFPHILVGQTQEPAERKTFDHVLFHGVTVDGATMAVEVAGGRPPDTPFRLEVTGDTGRIELLGGAPRGVQAGCLRLLLNGEEQRFDDAEVAGLPPAAVNVGGVYAGLRDDILAGSARTAGFGDALRLTQLVESLFDASSKGR